MKDYTVKIEGFMHGTFRHEGETVSLTEKQARTFLREGRIEARGRAKASGKSGAGETA